MAANNTDNRISVNRHTVFVLRCNARMTIGDRILAAIKDDSNKTQKACAAYAGLSTGAMNDLIRGRSQSSRQLDLIAEYLGVTTSWLRTGKGPKNRIGTTVSRIGENDAYPVGPVLRWVPIRGIAAVNKEGFWFDLDGSEEAQAFSYPTTDPAAYGVIIKGDNYDEAIPAGDCVLVEPSVPLKIDGRILLCLKDGSCCICRLRFYDDAEYKVQSLIDNKRMSFDASEVEYAHFVRGNFSTHGMIFRG